MTDQPTASIVIRCYNEEKHIGKLLVGIEEQGFDDYETIVVDSGSTDDTLAIARHFPTRIVHIDPDDFTFGRALNLGCSEARGRFCIFASAHVYPVYEDWLEQMLAPFDDPEVAAVYGKQRGGDTTRYSERQVFASWYPDESRRRQEDPFCNNANCAIRRELWEEYPYDEQLTGLEDLDWAERVTDEGWVVSYNAEAEVVHVHEETYRQIMNRYRREAMALKQIFPDQDMSIAEFLRLWLSNTASDYRHATEDGVLGKNLLDIPAFRLMQFWGAYRGFRRSGPVTERLRKTFYYPRGRQGDGHSGRERREDRRIEYGERVSPASAAGGGEEEQ